MKKKPWHVLVGQTQDVSFETLKAAERYAKRSVWANGQPREIWHEDEVLGQHVASVRRDALGRVWVDVLDSTLA